MSEGTGKHCGKRDTPGVAISPRVKVLLPLPLAGAYDYRSSVPLSLKSGDFVAVPLNQRDMIGVVWDSSPEQDIVPVPDHRLRPVTATLPVPPMTPSLRRFIDWVAAYTLSPPGAVLRMAMSVPAALEPPTPQAGWILAGPGGNSQPRITPERARVLAVMRPGEPMAGARIAEAAKVSTGVLRGMAEAGLLRPALLPLASRFARPDPEHPGPALGPEQAAAASALSARAAARAFSVTLLTGVTGSGKTEVYLDAVAECLRQGRQALVLLPEIALSAQWLDRFRARFGVAPALWHSEVGGRTRRETWRAVAEGQAPVVVGARSALFLPFPDLGLIVVDEEHETAFKQEDGVVYHARDMAVVRARLAEAACVLVSATPSLETLTNAQTGRYHALHLPRRHGGATLPEVAMIDLREAPPERGRFLSPPLIAAVEAALGRGEQAMLFLNRRGYAPLTLCRHCGHRLRCPNCTAWLVEHRAQRRLQCHHCGHAESPPAECPECGSAHSLTAVGPGVERVQEEVASLWPEARRIVMASDTMPGPAAAAAAAQAIQDRAVDLIIGTQIVAKGWHFPHLTLVGVVDADLGLAGGDLRAAERTVQLLHQVAGRAGRAEAPGRVLLQSYSPEHPVMKALVSGDLDAFMAEEAAMRRPGHWPPFGRLAALIVSSEDEREADRTARDLGLAAPGGEGVQVLGPAPAPLALLRGRHRRRLLLKTRRDIAVQPLLREWLARVEVPNSVRVQVDVDPVAFL
ncbi:primosomal protein N' [Siccirubricoccus sp. KC 17139]|uniref:Replication restart protein PriA n=1 Tax=Siccirubricoccus soli TaxID=2899147 RepID=A0ABT1D3G6_9PROT|nr:primosomal protein N' [Siccirubricoccus soli]MCO6416471.1 primosomal protein N' [Siccirubricoccus soli]MCP2682605.1 primosomal protein N' [Siccirubricoccus soli]